ncbi:hypothetical protein LSUE1_G004694 [Lachnellula suecica]|uniref:Uncharacterized protein n=1 Tax=Lachnellula suecica TaxID=602035 RepID=A0A8T9CHC7_9HELO|nr:hypothetical protein LSUE1_G004694 [Lachnellula suecica]
MSPRFQQFCTAMVRQVCFSYGAVRLEIDEVSFGESTVPHSHTVDGTRKASRLGSQTKAGQYGFTLWLEDRSDRMNRNPYSGMPAKFATSQSPTLTNSAAWTNCIQPIWIAAKVMSHPSEHHAILRIYERIERELGWKTRSRRDDLKSWWGDTDDDD